MNNEKLECANLYAGIDTIELRSDTPITITAGLNFEPSCIRKNNQSGKYFCKLNPDKANNGLQIYNSTDYYKSTDYMINNLGCTNPTITRIDYRIDSFDDNFNELQKLNRLLIWLIAEAYNIKNTYDSINFRTDEPLCTRIQNQYIEVENYNKGIQEPSGNVKNRLEFRSKKLYNTDENKEYTEFLKWCERLDKAITRENFEHLQSKINNKIYKRYTIECQQHGFILNEFLGRNKWRIFTNKQMVKLYRMIGYKDPEQSAKKYRQRKGIEYFSYKDICTYVQMIKDSLIRFFEN